MSDQHSHGIAPWFGEWMREREQTRREPTRSELTWDEVIDRFDNDGAGLLYTLIVMSHGRKEFDERTSDLLALLAMDRSRFNQLVAQFVQRGVIAASASGDTTTWTILRAPEGWSA